MHGLPQVDVNLFVYNSVRTVGATIESVLAQTWPELRLTLIDDGSDDGTADILARYAAHSPQIHILRHRHNFGAVGSFQHAFWHGEADFVLPKSGDDLLAPDFVEQIMRILLEHPQAAMCHAAGLIFTDAGVRGAYPPEHCLTAVGGDAIQRARHVMARYTSSPSFWGIYRRAATDRLARIRHRAGWDHAMLAELALYGEIRHVPQPLYWRRDGGKPVLRLARAATERGGRGLAVDDPSTEPHWRTPLITTAWAHLETFALARVDAVTRETLCHAAMEIFRARWLPVMREETAALRTAIPALLAADLAPLNRALASRNLADLLHTIHILLPEEDLSAAWQNLRDINAPRLPEAA